MRASLLSPWLSPWLALALAACGGVTRIGTQADSRTPRGFPDPMDPLVSVVEITITNVTKSDAETFRSRLLSGEAQRVELKSYNAGTAVYEVEFQGCECELPARIALFPSPGLRYQGRVTKLKYSAFDNQPPTLTFVLPERDDVRLFADAEQLIAVQVKDSDVAAVMVNGLAAEHYRADIYLVRVRMQPGPNKVAVWARDREGNEATAEMSVMAVPSLTADQAIWKTVDGKAAPGSTVLVERREIAVDAKGHYKAVIPLPKGQTQIEIIEITPEGSKTVSVKDITR